MFHVRYVLIFCFFYISATGSLLAQEAHPIKLHILDAADNKPVPAVIINDDGKILSRADSAGYSIIPAASLHNSRSLRIRSLGYRDYNLELSGLSSVIIYLERTTSTLDEAVVHSRQDARRILKAYSEHIVDYVVSATGVMLATYGGTREKTGKLLFLDHNGDTLAYRALDFEPLSLIRGCDGDKYVVTHDSMYRVWMDADRLQLSRGFSVKYLAGYMNCQQSIHGKLYFRYLIRQDFRMLYGMIPKTDSVLQPMYVIDDQATTIASEDEYNDILSKLANGSAEARSRAKNIALNRRLLDAHVLRTINGSGIYSLDDSLVIFDLFHRTIAYFTEDGTLIKNIAFDDAITPADGVHILKDAATERFYVQYYQKNAQVLREVNMQTGLLLPGKIVLDKPFPQQVKIYDGRIYYLWQSTSPPTKQQLYVQR